MNYEILIDLGKLKRLYSGLGQFSDYYGIYISNTEIGNLNWNFLVPSHYVKKFGHEWGYEKLSFVRRHFPFLCRKYDLWHALHQDSGYYPGYKDTSYILTIHDLNFLREKSRTVANRRLKTLQKKVNKASYITCVSHYTESIAKNNLDLKDIPCRVIYNGVDIDTEKSVQKPDYLPHGKFLFSVGMLLEKKNFHVLVKMMARIPDLNLIIAGDKSDAYAERIQREIREYKLEDRITLPGIISHNDKIYLYRNCEAFLFPSKIEGFGLPVIEAMRFGKPVFISRYASLPEIGSDLAYYWENFDPDHMSHIFLEKMQLYERDKEVLSHKIREHSNRFSWEESIKHYIEVYGETIRTRIDKRS